MTKVDDFFFGELNRFSDEPVSLSLKSFIHAGEGTPRRFVTNQLDRLVSAHGGAIKVYAGGSGPDFHGFLNCLSPESIGKVVIFSRPDERESPIRAFLSCELYLPNGVVTFGADWCAHSPQRASELVGSLLVPLHKYGLNQRTFLRDLDGVVKPLGSLFDNHEYELKSVFALAQHENALGYTSEATARFKEMQDTLADARTTFDAGFFNQNREQQLESALSWALEWIDAIPQDTELPAMPGFDRDYVNSLIEK